MYKRGVVDMAHANSDIIESFCLGGVFRWQDLKKAMSMKRPNTASLSHEVLILGTEKDEEGAVIVYEYGCVVFFGTDEVLRDKHIKFLLKYTQSPYDNFKKEKFHFVFAESTRIKGNQITLKSESMDAKVAIGYAITQSVRLSQYESVAEDILGDLKNATTALAKYGRVIIGRSLALKKTGRIFTLKAQINLYSNLLDTPDYFWDRHEAEKVFLASKHEMDMDKRLENLNKRLDIMQELYDMLAEQIKHEHYIMMEMTIIILISFEVINTIAHWWTHL
ncbi:MAG: RMD1 family protein [Pseudomonadota bacterium]|nr:RMD1 family protein [Pseudomonadota bacterium]